MGGTTLILTQGIIMGSPGYSLLAWVLGILSISREARLLTPPALLRDS